MKLQFRGPAHYRAMSAATLCRASAEVTLRRLRRGPLSPGWNLAIELGTELMRRQLVTAFRMPDIVQARTYLDSLVLRTSVLNKVTFLSVSEPNVSGTWIIPRVRKSAQTILFLHGGGYAFNPKSFYRNLGAMIAVSAGARVFALEYRLTPEHQFPAQLTDATKGYQWLIRNKVDPRELVIVGDSAGGNLALTLLLSLRNSGSPLPSLAVCLSPATDFEGKSVGVPVSSPYDWITQEMATHWAQWYCSPEERCNPLVSPLNADLGGLPPIYIQAGDAEILLPSIKLFVQRAKEQGADVVLETWPEMNHDFQAFGYDVPQSAEAIKRIGDVIASYIAGTKEQPTAI